MRVFIQWARGVPGDWEGYSLTTNKDILDLPRKIEPFAGMAGTMSADAGGGYGTQTVLDPSHPTANDAGWYNDISILGTRFSGDHVHLTISGVALKVTYWNDDEIWADRIDRHAQEWTILLPTLDVSKGLFRQNITKRVWAEDAARIIRWQAGDVSALLPWSDWEAPGPSGMVLHGVWMTPTLLAEHLTAQTGPRGLIPESIINDPSKSRAQKDTAMLARWT